MQEQTPYDFERAKKTSSLRQRQQRQWRQRMQSPLWRSPHPKRRERTRRRRWRRRRDPRTKTKMFPRACRSQPSQRRPRRLRSESFSRALCCAFLPSNHFADTKLSTFGVSVKSSDVMSREQCINSSAKVEYINSQQFRHC